MIEAAQPAKLENALKLLQPRIEGRSNIFVIGVAGWASQQVFIRELNQSLHILDNRFGTATRTIALANTTSGDGELPLATIQNLAVTLKGVAARMDKENDVLILTMTSHGSRNGFALYNHAIVNRELHPEGLKAMLDEVGIKNRILIVSSCYSGIFLRALEDENTMVVTAAAANRTSFGCSDERHWTYFGNAFFAHGLNQESTLAGAFVIARDLVGKWEAKIKVTASLPQMHIGSALQRRFGSIVGFADARKAAALTQPINSAISAGHGELEPAR